MPYVLHHLKSKPFRNLMILPFKPCQQVSRPLLQTDLPAPPSLKALAPALPSPTFPRLLFLTWPNSLRSTFLSLEHHYRPFSPTRSTYLPAPLGSSDPCVQGKGKVWDRKLRPPRRKAGCRLCLYKTLYARVSAKRSDEVFDKLKKAIPVSQEYLLIIA